MGYEVIFSYKEAAGNPGEYSEEVKKKTAKIGKTTEDVPMEALAGKVISQLARRNILIVDVEIYEYAKKKISYREASDGIVIKNKKFGFGLGSVMEVSGFCDDGEGDEEDFKPVPSPSKDLADRSCPLVNMAPPARRPVRHEKYEPEPLSEFKAKQKGLKFTVGKKYPVYSEESLGTSIVYNTTDDAGRDVKVGSEYFVAIGSGLVEQDEGPRYVGAEDRKEEINLWGKYETMDVPDIRRK